MALPPPVASVDIGTNSTKLLVARHTTDGTITPVHEEFELTRLGEGSQKDRILKPEPMRRTLKTLAHFKKIIDQHGVARVAVAATMCTREASNQKEFCDAVKKTTGWQVRVLSGEEEAHISYKGARTLWPNVAPPIAALDIGGGSSEWIVETSRGIRVESLALGSVRETESFASRQPPHAPELAAMRAHIRKVWSGLRAELTPPEGTSVIGIGGTVTTIEKMIDPQESTHRVTVADLEKLLGRLATQDVPARLKAYPGLEAGRADVILAGAAILLELLQHFKIGHCLVSARGIRYGLVAEL